MEINFDLKRETKTCYVFDTGERPDLITLYLKKTQIKEAGIDPEKGITVTINQKED